MFSVNKNNLFCSAGIKAVTIDTKGNLWPCQAYVGKYDYTISNINENYFKYNPEMYEIIKSFNEENDTCNECVARFCCNKCALSNPECTNLKCKDKQRTVELVIKKIIKMIEDGEFEQFDNNFRELI